jgi:hypothetical protein
MSKLVVRGELHVPSLGGYHSVASIPAGWKEISPISLLFHVDNAKHAPPFLFRHIADMLGRDVPFDETSWYRLRKSPM